MRQLSAIKYSNTVLNSKKINKKIYLGCFCNVSGSFSSRFSVLTFLELAIMYRVTNPFPFSIFDWLYSFGWNFVLQIELIKNARINSVTSWYQVSVMSAYFFGETGEHINNLERNFNISLPLSREINFGQISLIADALQYLF